MLSRTQCSQWLFGRSLTGGWAAPDTEREGTWCRAWPFPPHLSVLGCCLWLCAGSGLCHRTCVQLDPAAVGSTAVPGVRVRKRLCRLLGTVQARTCSGQCLVNDSFVGAWGWLRSACDGHVSCWTGCRKIPCQRENRCLGQVKPFLAAYGNQPPVLCFLLPSVGLRHHLSLSWWLWQSWCCIG